MISIMVGLLGGLVAGGATVFVTLNSVMKKRSSGILKEAEAEAEALKKEKILQAKEKFLQMKEEHEKDVRERERSVAQAQEKAKQREQTLSRQQQELAAKEKNVDRLKGELEQKVEGLERRREETEKMHAKQVNLLENISGLNAEEARKQLVESLKDEARTAAMSHIKDAQEEAKLTANKEAKRIVIQTIQRVATEHAIENSVSVFHIENDDVKGRIIGREGRNIRAFELATGVDVIIDDTPDTVVVSSFDPVRREVARNALEALVVDGRIHPATIEEFVKRAQDEVGATATQAGEDAVARLNINGLHPEIISLLGKLRYRFSYNQNVLDHSIETAFLASMIASEVGLDPNLAKRAGLLHDIGKAASAELEGSHAHIGAEFIKRYGETPIVVNAVEAHHEEVKPETVYAGLVILADTISAVRPGARAESITGYVQRLERLEQLATSIEGVQQAFAIQAGREIRVVVAPHMVTDDRAREIARELRQRVETELEYPSAIKITVIREQRFTETAT